MYRSTSNRTMLMTAVMWFCALVAVGFAMLFISIFIDAETDRMSAASAQIDPASYQSDVYAIYEGQAIPMPETSTMIASYYGFELAGNYTASGDIFDPLGLTAASPYLPFGTVLEVCYIECTTVTVNDRGPYVAGRDLDLSLGAARAIGLEGVGVAPVAVRVI